MIKRNFHLTKAIALLSLLLWLPTSHGAQEPSTPDTPQNQTKAFVATALDYLKAHGKEAAFTEFSKPEGQFVKGLSYIFVVDYNGEMLANGGDPKMVGTNKFNDKDIQGNRIIQDIIAKAKQGGGWVSYYWNDPVTKKVGCKSSYVVSVQDQFVVGSGFYHAPDEKGDCSVPA